MSAGWFLLQMLVMVSLSMLVALPIAYVLASGWDLYLDRREQ